MGWKSDTCFSRSGSPVTAYESRSEAARGAKTARRRSGVHLVPYACSRCDDWHLAPKERITPVVLSTCGCEGRDGQAKAAYASESTAVQRGKIIQGERGTPLFVYQCKGGLWHLTSMAEPPPGELPARPVG